jgi:hypothetical protein
MKISAPIEPNSTNTFDHGQDISINPIGKARNKRANKKYVSGSHLPVFVLPS